MAAVTVGADTVRYDALEALTNVASIGGGAGATVEPDIVYQGTNSVSRKVTAAGFSTSTGANRNHTATGRKTWLVKTWITNFAALNATGLEVRIGSTSGGASNYYFYRLASSAANEAYPSLGGFIIEAIDPNVAAHRTGTTGTPNLTTVAAYGCVGNLGTTSKAENLVMDAVDVGVGLYLTGGDGADPDGTFSSFVSFDEGDKTNGRFGHVVTRSGVLFVRGRLIIGASSASEVRTAAATVFTDSGRVLSFPDNRADVGYSGLTVDLGNATTTVSWSGCVFLSQGRTSPDTRAVLAVYGTSGALTAASCTFRNFGSLLLTSKVTLSSCVFASCAGLTLAGASIDSCAINGHATASGVAFITSADPSTIQNCTFNNTGGTGHAIELTTPGTYTFTGNVFTGYGAGGTNDAAIYNNSGGAVTLNISGGTTPTVRNGSGASTTVNSSVSVTLTGLKNPSEVRVFNAGTTNEVAGTGAENVITGSHTFSIGSGVSIDIVVLSLGYQNLRILSYSTTTTTSLPVSQVIDRQYENP